MARTKHVSKTGNTYHNFEVGKWLSFKEVFDQLPQATQTNPLASRVCDVLELGTHITVTFRDLCVADMCGEFVDADELVSGDLRGIDDLPTFVDIEPELLPYVVFKRELSGKIDMITRGIDPFGRSAASNVRLTIGVDDEGDDIDIDVPLRLIDSIRFDEHVQGSPVPDPTRVKLRYDIDAWLAPTVDLPADDVECAVHIEDIISTRYRVSGLLAMVCGMRGWTFCSDAADVWFDDHGWPSAYAVAAFQKFNLHEVNVSVDAGGLHIGCKHIKWAELNSCIDALAGLLGWDVL